MREPDQRDLRRAAGTGQDPERAERDREDPEILVEIERDRGSRDREALQPEQEVRQPVQHGATLAP